MLSPQEIITLAVIAMALVLFITEWVSVDIVAIFIIVSLVIFGVITPEEGVEGFSNKATLTVAFMFILSASLLKSGALQYITFHLAKAYRYNFTIGMIAMMLLVALVSAFINNTPVVAVFIPVIIQIGHTAGIASSKMLIPLSFASIFGGTCTLIGTSTNILISGMVERDGLPPISMFEFSGLGLVFLAIGVSYMLLIGIRLLPDRKGSDNLDEKFSTSDYLTEIELLESSESVGKKIMDSSLIRELGLDIINVERNGSPYNLPQGDFVLRKNDILKVRCDVSKILKLKDQIKIQFKPTIKIGNHNQKERNSALVELVVTANSELEGKTLKELDFRRRFRSVPLAIRHREDVLHENLYQVKLKSGDVILAETKAHYINELRRMEMALDTPFIMLSENKMEDFDKRKFYSSVVVILTIVSLATLNIVDIMIGSMAGAIILVLLGNLSMKDAYESINWQVIFLLAGALSLGMAMNGSGLNIRIASLVANDLGQFGPVLIVSGLYLITSILTEMMSNNATAALLTPIAIATASSMGLSPMPFVMAILFAASSSFLTPVGYQTNTMVYSAGQYRFIDFFRSGILLNILFWIAATLLIPLFFPF